MTHTTADDGFVFSFISATFESKKKLPCCLCDLHISHFSGIKRWLWLNIQKVSFFIYSESHPPHRFSALRCAQKYFHKLCWYFPSLFRFSVRVGIFNKKFRIVISEWLFSNVCFIATSKAFLTKKKTKFNTKSTRAEWKYQWNYLFVYFIMSCKSLFVSTVHRFIPKEKRKPNSNKTITSFSHWILADNFI